MSRNPLVLRALAPLSLLLAVAGCSSSASPPMMITVMPATVALSVGGTKQLEAVGFTSDGATAGNVNAKAIWSSTDTSVATVNSAGVVTGLAAGKSTVSATIDGVSGTSAITVVGNKPTDMGSQVPPEDMAHSDDAG